MCHEVMSCLPALPRMQTLLLPIWWLANAGLALSQNAEPSAPRQAEILGEIPDGTPAVTPPEPEPYVVQPEDILETTVTHTGDRTITVHEIKPIPLPPPADPAPAPSPEALSAFQQRLAQRQAIPRPQRLHLSATVYRSATSGPRTQLRVWTGAAHPLTLWSSADFALISGIQNFTDAQGGTHHLFLGWGSTDLDQLRQRRASGRSTPPEPGRRLRRRIVPARLQAEGAAKHAPPPEQDVTIHFWRTEDPLPAAPANQGGAH